LTPESRKTARWLAAQYAKRRPFQAFPPGLAPADLGAAYAAQDAFVALKARSCGGVAGWKIALSNPAMQQMVGLASPVSGRLHQRQLVGGPARVSASAYGRLIIEFEIAVEIGADIAPPGGRCTPELAARSVAAVRPAFEIADDRNADYASLSHHALQMVADNAWTQGAVLGERRTDWRALDLAALRGEVLCNGEGVGEGFGRDLMGHPMNALAWLASHAAARGTPMRVGDIAILGSMITTRFPKPGEHWRFALDGFPALDLRIDP